MHLRLFIAVICAIVLTDGATSASVKDTCPYLPQYKVLMAKIRDLSPDAALQQLSAYRADDRNENPAACEGMSLDNAISERETSLVLLRSTTGVLKPRDVFHCGALEPASLECNSTFMDGTGQPNARAFLPPPTKKVMSVRIENRIGGSRLEGLYRTTLDDVQVGRRPVRLSTAGPVAIAPSPYRTVVIAIVTGPGPNRVRQFVWYP